MKGGEREGVREGSHIEFGNIYSCLCIFNL